MITLTLGVREFDGTVYYLHSGAPIFSHETGDLNKFRYITSNLLVQGLCSNQDIADAFHVSLDSVRRWKNKLTRHGRSHKLLPEVLERIQSKLYLGQSAYSIANGEGISESSIRYAAGLGRFKKNLRPK